MTSPTLKKVIDYKTVQVKSNRLQNKDPVDRRRFGRGVTIKVEWCFVGPVSVAPPGVKTGAVWCPHPGPLPLGEGEKQITFFGII
jgi:hypothetical protein